MGRIYTTPYNGTFTLAGTDADWLEMSPADDKPVVLRRLVMCQYSEVGDAAEEGLRFSLQRFPATVTSSNGSAITIASIDSHNTVAAGFSAEANGTTLATTSGTAVVLEEFAWNIRMSPLEFWWADEKFAPIFYQGEAMILRCHTTVTDDVSISITAYFEEL